MFKRIQVQGPEFLLAIFPADFLIEADFCFVTQPLALKPIKTASVVV
jgi:hypothetical protein